jgi:hypothetical protein
MGRLEQTDEVIKAAMDEAVAGINAALDRAGGIPH